MIAVPGFDVHEKIYESPKSLVYRAVRQPDHRPVILKILKEDYPTPEEVIRYRQEYEITRSLKSASGVIGVYGLEKYQKTLVMILEDFGGESLKILSASGKFSPEEFLSAAVDIAKGVEEIHRADIIHKDINPSNIVMNRKTGQVKIIDFGISTALSLENPAIKNPNMLEGTLAYISPEQTGRMNRVLDYRADFYSLGATFYELLTGKTPFETDDPMELVHCHIAGRPVPPDREDPSIPGVLSDMVMKLLSKNAEDRYQSAWGIRADLEECLNRLRDCGEIIGFPLGARDVPDRFRIPGKLYGREAQIKVLLDAFARVSRGNTEILMISGYSGIGKTALVREIYKPITRQRGYFVSGKFDQIHRRPYGAIVQALQELVRQLLTESGERLGWWREEILAALGPNGQVMIDIIPELELIIGLQPEVTDVPPEQAQNRFNLVFRKFIRVFTKPEHPLVIFLDDLQWADSATLKLLSLLETEQGKYLMLIGAYRDNEVDDAHPMMMTVNGLRRAGVKVHDVRLGPLGPDHITGFICDALHCDPDRAASLAEIVEKKTGGNPFFMNEFLKSLYQEGLLLFDAEYGGWRWDAAEIQSRNITDNVVELMAEKIGRLPLETKRLLQLAACIGNRFDLEMLSVISEKEMVEAADILKSAIAEGLIIESRTLKTEVDKAKIEVHSSDFIFLISDFRYKFAHDRIQQASYFLIDEADRPIIHNRIGKLLRANRSREYIEQNIIEVVEQLNIGSDIVSEKSERLELAELNLMAGIKAKSSSAFETAHKYFCFGIELLGGNPWESSYDLTLELHREAITTAYLNGYYERMDALSRIFLQKALTILDKIEVYETLIKSYVSRNRGLEGINLGLHVLELLDVRMPKSNSKFALMVEFVKIKLLLKGKNTKFLTSLPPLRDPRVMAAMRIMITMTNASYLKVHYLFALIGFKIIELSLKYGQSAASSMGFGIYSLFLCGGMGNIEKGYKYFTMWDGLTEKSELKKYHAVIINGSTCFLLIWKERIQKINNIAISGYKSGLENGDFFNASVCAFIYCYHSYFSGRELNELQKEMSSYKMAFQQLQQIIPHKQMKPFHQSVLNLLGKSENPCVLTGAEFDETIDLPLLGEENEKTIIAMVYLNKLMLHYVFQEYHNTTKNLNIIEKINRRSINSGMIGIMMVFYGALANISLFPEVSKSDRKKILEKVSANQKKMKKWAHHAPMNYLHKYYLVEAERMRVLKKPVKAADLYDQAIQLARENEFINEEALANELAGKFYLESGKTRIASVYLQEARYCYLQWGALAKVRHLDEKYSDLLASHLRGQKGPNGTISTATSTTGGSGEKLDLSTVIKASRMISGEIVLDKLLEKLMKIVIENAGAQKVALILNKGGALTVDAFLSAEKEKILHVQQPIPIADFPELSAGIVNFTARTREAVVLADAAAQGAYTADPYIAENRPKSILSIPILRHGDLTGILYLENNSAKGAFTADRVEVLKLIATQAAISIENARFYAELEHRVEQRTEELHKANTALLESVAELKKTQAQLVQSEKMASLGELVAGIAHEMNTPLGVINANNDMVLRYIKRLDTPDDTGKDEATLKFITKIKERAEHSQKACASILSIINSLRVFARLDEAEYQSVRVDSLIEDTLVMMKNRLKTGITVHRDYRFKEPVRCYPGRLNQVFLNIINNAHHAMNGAGDLYISVGPADGSNDVLITFRDTGPGIQEDHLPKIFDPGFTTKGVGIGTGLGLSICFRIISENHKGCIWAENHPEGGAAISIRIPKAGKKTDKERKGEEQ